MTPDGENDKPGDDAPDPPIDPDLTLPAKPARVTPDLGWGRTRSAQPPGERITWERPSAEEPSQGSTPDAPTVRAPRAADDTPPPPSQAIPAPPQPSEPTPAFPTTLRSSPRPAPPIPPVPPARTTKPAVASSTPSAVTAVTSTTTQPDADPSAARPGTDPGTARAAVDQQLAALETQVGDQVSDLQAQLTALADQSTSAGDTAGERRAGTAIAELAQQLAATQSQVAAIGAQLTTLSHRISYDLERSSQTTSERILRDLEQMPDEVRQKVSGDLGPVLDDLTDQVENDRTALTTAVESVQGALAPRLTSIGEIVDGLPLTNVEILNSLQSLGTDLEDRFTRFASRVGDQVGALERSFAAELTRLRGQVDELRTLTAKPASGADAIDRMAGQVERLVQRTPSSEEVVEALELLVSEHLEVLRDNLDTRVAALGPAMQEELDALRAESLAGMAAAEEVLAERIEVLEASLVERMDLALSDQVDAVDGLLAERHAELMGAVQGSGAERVDELAELREQIAALPERTAAGSTEGVDAGALQAVSDELKALRRRISLRLEGGDSELTPDQIASLAAQIAEHLH